MKVFLLAYSLLVTFVCSGQVLVDGVALDTLTATYCQFTCESATGLTKTRVQVDYGQRYVYTGFNRQRVGDKQEADIRFNSCVDVLNFMDRNGWDLIGFTTKDSKSIYLLRRKKR